MNKAALLILPLLYIFLSCGSQKVVAPKYYVIEIPMDSILKANMNSSPATDKYCEIMNVDVNPAYSGTDIANRGSSRALTYYTQHNWAIRPSLAFTRLALDYFKHAPVFKGASDRYWRIQPDYILETTIYHLEVMQDNNLMMAHLQLEFILRDGEDEEVVVRHRADRYEALEDKDLNLFATEIGEIFYEELEQLSAKILQKAGTSP